MPFVEVWVDELDCSGQCENARELRRRRDYAVGLLFDGQVNAAIDALTKGVLPEGWTCGDDLRAKYNEWAAGEFAGLSGPSSLLSEAQDD